MLLNPKEKKKRNKNCLFSSTADRKTCVGFDYDSGTVFFSSLTSSLLLLEGDVAGRGRGGG